MKQIGLIILLLVVFLGEVYPQMRDWRVHRRGLLHQTVYNTGELGRAYNAGGTVQPGSPSMEWPAYSSMVLDRVNYPGQHNSFGSGIWIAGTPLGKDRLYAFCGATSNSNGDPIPVVGVYSIPLNLQKIENFPVLASGELNPAFNPDEAEEIIISSWDTPVGVRVTRTSRAWSYPGYDSFIIYEYEFENVSNDTINDLFITFANTFGPSMFGYQRNHGSWGEANFRGQPPAGLGDHFARYDLKRFMSYNHEREGLPEVDFFEQWSAPGNRGGLNSPQAVGIMVLRYDYDHLSLRDQTTQFFTKSDSAGMWDENSKAKQPFLLRYENGNLPGETKTGSWMNPAARRKTGIWQSVTDSTRFADQFEADLWDYWKGRTQTSANLSWWQPVSRGYGFYPYYLTPGQKMRFTVAEVAGYGPGVASDRQYTDLGGAVRAGVDEGAYFNPVPSWYDTLQYNYLGSKNYIGSEYLKTHPLPWYVTPGVVSIRDVADRAIQMYTGDPLMKYDSLQYKPEEAPTSGRYNTISIPVPAPVIRIEDTKAAANKVLWGPQVESFNSPRMHAAFSHYEVLR
ncbi:MAG: T9SS C-terminal target domain-containing protein, partial [Calditrichales bacterium]